ncbi:hypothetical protein Tco_1236704 [Tanacetum coccineum]
MVMTVTSGWGGMPPIRGSDSKGKSWRGEVASCRVSRGVRSSGSCFRRAQGRGVRGIAEKETIVMRTAVSASWLMRSIINDGEGRCAPRWPYLLVGSVGYRARFGQCPIQDLIVPIFMRPSKCVTFIGDIDACTTMQARVSSGIYPELCGAWGARHGEHGPVIRFWMHCGTYAVKGGTRVVELGMLPVCTFAMSRNWDPVLG